MVRRKVVVLLRDNRLDYIEEGNESNSREEHSRERSRRRVSPANRYNDSREASCGSTKDDKEITPKPNEVPPGFVDIREFKNTTTRHHLDDSEA